MTKKQAMKTEQLDLALNNSGSCEKIYQELDAAE